MSSRATIPEYQPLSDTKALARHNAPGLSCHLGADILVCHPQSHVIFVYCHSNAICRISNNISGLFVSAGTVTCRYVGGLDSHGFPNYLLQQQVKSPYPLLEE